jgi:hypothetical protein
LWLGPPERPLFAWLDVPDDGVAAVAVVICPSMGLEAAYSVRALRDLSHRLARARCATLRFDYAATGDSVGTWRDPDLVAEWLGNIRIAIDAARALGVARVGLVGLRVGATLAAAELARGGPVDDVVWWDPCATGRAFLREQIALSAIRREMAIQWGVAKKGDVADAGDEPDDGVIAAPGVVFSAATAADLRPVAISAGDGELASRELVLARKGRRLERALSERLAMPHVASSEVIGQEELFGEFPSTPGPTLDQIVSWLSPPGGPVATLAMPEPRLIATHREAGGPAVRERPLALGPLRLFGVLTEPEASLPPSAPTVVFLNIGVIPHQGPARLWVELARACAATGTARCLRVDLSGIGDSPVRPGRTEMQGFPLDALQDMADIRQAAPGESAELILMGVCSGADHAIGSALAEPVGSICIVNPAMYGMRWRDDKTAALIDGEAPPEARDRPVWGATGPLLTRVMARLAPHKSLTRWIPAPGWWVLKRWLMTGSPAGTLERLVQSGADLFIVVGRREGRRVYRGEQRRLRSLIAGDHVRMETISHLEHSLMDRTSQERVAELFVAYVTGRAVELADRRHPPAAG